MSESAATGSMTRAAERLHLTQSALSHQLRDVESRLAVPLFLRLGRRMVLTPAGDRVLVAVVAPSHSFAKRPFVEADDFADEHLIIYTADRSDSYTFRRILSPAGVEPARVSQVPLTEAILELVKAGLGVSVMARWAIEPALKTGAVRAVCIGRRGVFRPWAAVSLRDRAEPKWQKEFIALLSKQALPAKVDRRA